MKNHFGNGYGIYYTIGTALQAVKGDEFSIKQLDSFCDPIMNVSHIASANNYCDMA